MTSRLIYLGIFRKMNIHFIILAICSVIILSQNVNAQTVVVQNNNGTSTTSDYKDPNILYINGIPSTADIGGIEAIPATDAGVVIFKNYQPFTVTVTYKMFLKHVKFGGIAERKVGSIIIPAGQTREVKLLSNEQRATEIYTITRKL